MLRFLQLAKLFITLKISEFMYKYFWQFSNVFKTKILLFTISDNGNSRPEVLLGNSVLKICSKFSGECPCRSCKAALLKSHFSMGVLL